MVFYEVLMFGLRCLSQAVENEHWFIQISTEASSECLPELVIKYFI